MPQSVHCDDGIDLRNLQQDHFREGWSALRQEYGLNFSQERNLKQSYPFDITRAAVQWPNLLDEWKPGDDRDDSQEAKGGALTAQLMPISLIPLTACRLCGAAYLQSPLTPDGAKIAKWNNADGNVVEWAELYVAFCYQAWDQQTEETVEPEPDAPADPFKGEVSTA